MKRSPEYQRLTTNLERARADAHELGPESEEGKQKIKLAQSLDDQRSMCLAYILMRKVIGVLAAALPIVVLIVGKVFYHQGIPGSISGYYYTHLRTYFTGTLCVLGVFMFTYQLRDVDEYKWDNILSTFAGVTALGVAFFPTTPNVDKLSSGQKGAGTVHLLCAGALFAFLAVFALVIFRKHKGYLSGRKKLRNKIYAVCGGIIAGCIVIILVMRVVANGRSGNSLYWLEAVAVVAFGVSWLVKGETFPFLNDTQEDIVKALQPPTPPTADSVTAGAS